MRNLFVIALLILFCGCEQQVDTYKNKATEECNNLKLSVGRLFPNEIIYLYYNNDLILKYKVDSLEGFRFKRDFCIDYKKEGILKIVSEHYNTIYIDTAINVKKQDFGYLLMVSVPHPINWQQYYENDSPVPTKDWGYLPINKSLRLISLRPDTIFKNTWTDIIEN